MYGPILGQETSLHDGAINRTSNSVNTLTKNTLNPQTQVSHSLIYLKPALQILYIGCTGLLCLAQSAVLHTNNEGRPAVVERLVTLLVALSLSFRLLLERLKLLQVDPHLHITNDRYWMVLDRI